MFLIDFDGVTLLSFLFRLVKNHFVKLDKIIVQMIMNNFVYLL